ncbi:hypothetical protein D3C73_1264720 [compost metagenome]
MSDQGANVGFDRFDLTSTRSHFSCASTGDDDHAIGVGDHDVTGADSGCADRHWLVHRLNLYAVFAGAHKAAFAKYRIAVAQRFVHVTANSVDDRCSDLPVTGVLGHDVAPDGAVGTAAIVDDHHITGCHVFDEIAHCARRYAGRDVLHGEGRSDDNLAVVVQRCHAEALTGQA